MGLILCGGAILQHVTKMFCSPNRSAHGLHRRKTVRIRAKINGHGTVLVNSMDPCEKDPDSASFHADPHRSTWNGEAIIRQKIGVLGSADSMPFRADPCGIPGGE